VAERNESGMSLTVAVCMAPCLSGDWTTIEIIFNTAKECLQWQQHFYEWPNAKVIELCQ
jgi:hypothetical protein